MLDSWVVNFIANSSAECARWKVAKQNNWVGARVWRRCKGGGGEGIKIRMSACGVIEEEEEKKEEA